MHNLVSQHNMLGLNAQAVSLATDLLERSGRVVVPRHDLTLLATDQFANVYRGLGREAEAETLFKQSIEARQRAFGPLNPELLRTKALLASSIAGKANTPRPNRCSSTMWPAWTRHWDQSTPIR